MKINHVKKGQGVLVLASLWAGLSCNPTSCQDTSSRLSQTDSKQENMMEKEVKPQAPRTRHIDDQGRPLFTNALAQEGSPYLQQHAHNPVNWMPWSDEAFALAKKTHRPVLLSVGYSTCHWCHVMEEESFEDLEIAQFMNENYVCIKVDREERPDVDDTYMLAVQMMTGRGGWPMTVWLTPERRPFFGGTYFPPRDGQRGGSVGFLTVLKKLKFMYDEKGEEVEEQAQEIVKHLQASTSVKSSVKLPGKEVLKKVYETFLAQYDDLHGGFGGAPKFPRPTVFSFLLRYARRSGESKAQAMVLHTLRQMAQGGIYDQVGGGFHRYATDYEWLVPHFEKMLYDNAQLASAYLDAFQVSGDPQFARVAREILDYVLKEMTHSNGGFYSATDADSEGEEGTFFVWSEDEFEKNLAGQADEAKAFFGVTKAGNFEGKNVLTAKKPLEDFPPNRRQEILKIREKLYEIRNRRVKPHLDDKVLTSWNGLMIEALARGAFVLSEPRYLKASEAAARYALSPFEQKGKLVRSQRGGKVQAQAFLDDYAFLLGGVISLFESTGKAAWLQQAQALAKSMIENFGDTQAGGFFFTTHEGEAILTRKKPYYDGAEPSGNSSAALNLLRLASITGDRIYEEWAEKTLLAFGQVLEQNPTVAPLFAAALDYQLDRPQEVVILKVSEQADISDLLKPLREAYGPNSVKLITSEGEAQKELGELTPLVQHRAPLGGKSTAFVCEGRTCQLPTSDPGVFAQQLEKVVSY